MTGSYINYVLAQSRQNPCLQNLCQFIHEDQSRHNCRIFCQNFSSRDVGPIQFGLNIRDLTNLINEVKGNTNSNKSLGCILIVEDLSRDVIEILGSAFDIDPLFFASHIYGPYVKISSPKASTSMLPSKIRNQNFLSLQYQRVLEFEDNPRDLRLFRDCNVPRRVTLLPPTKSKYIGLGQHCCSVMLTSTKDSTWLGIVLVDAPATNTFLSSEKAVILQSQPFQGGYEDFLGHKPCSEKETPDISGPERRSLLEDLIFYWDRERPPGFNAEAPTLLSLAYYPLKIVAAEWVCYVEVMSHSIKQYEYSTETAAETAILTKLDRDLRSLQVWGRRCMQTLYKLRSVVKLVQPRMMSDPAQGHYALIVEDYEHIAAMVDTYGRRMETMVPVVTSLVQIADTRRSLREAANVTRLTNLALFFVPLSFVSGLFSMNDGVTADGLRIYFAVAIPLCFFVFLTARLLPHIKIDEICNRLRRLRKDPTVQV